MNIFMMKRARAAREARWDATGEGSRGGHIIGHTSSGKPIYRDHTHPSHAGFSEKEHNEVVKMRIKPFQLLRKKLVGVKPAEQSKQVLEAWNTHQRAINYHSSQAEFKKGLKKKDGQ